MPTELNQFERYLQGLPLNEENAALMEGRDPALELKSETFTFKDSKEELTAEDRLWLRRLVFEPGFAILLRLLDSAVRRREESATLFSSQDPLNNGDKIAKEWAYVACFKTVLADIRRLLDTQVRETEEIQKIKNLKTKHLAQNLFL